MTIAKMTDKEFDQWMAALRSGKYQQVQGTLMGVSEFGEITGYCCLGVLNNLFHLGPMEAEILIGNVLTFEGHDITYDRIMKFTQDLRISRIAIKMNDEDKSFSEIANALEEYYYSKGKHK